MTRRTFLAVSALALLASPAEAAAGSRLEVSWHPSDPRVGDVALLSLTGAAEGASVDGNVGGRPLAFFRDGRGYAALVGFDLEQKAEPVTWRVEVRGPDGSARRTAGTVRLGGREFAVQRLTLPPSMVELDPETERRALAERETLQALYRTITPERLWRGSFARPLAGAEVGTGFGSRRILNGLARAPHAGTDYAAPRGTPVLALNDGRVALVADYFFQGRMVVVDHGLGLYTLYFHLDEVRVEGGERVTRGQPLGTVGSTGRATGPHLHLGAQLGPARIDPERLLALPARD